MNNKLPDFIESIKMSLLHNRQQGHLYAIIITIVSLFIGVIWLLLSPPAPKPMPPATPPQITKAAGDDYLICVARGQMTTGYTEAAGAPPGSSGIGYRIGTVAVHPRVATQWGGDPRHPLIPFGTVLHLMEPNSIKINNQWYDQMIVNDTGDINLGLWSGYPYWLDIYYGATNQWTNRSARDYGTRKVDYYWIEKWR